VRFNVYINEKSLMTRHNVMYIMMWLYHIMQCLTLRHRFKKVIERHKKTDKQKKGRE
jgi:hypothetical protein